MNSIDKKMKKEKQREQQNNFIEGDHVVPQGGEIDENDEPVEEKSKEIYKQINPPSTPPQKTEKKIPNLRSH
jgi:hypothetical protein